MHIKELYDQILTKGSEMAPKCLILFLLLVCSQKATFWISPCSSWCRALSAFGSELPHPVSAVAGDCSSTRLAAVDGLTRALGCSALPLAARLSTGAC